MTLKAFIALTTVFSLCMGASLAAAAPGAVYTMTNAPDGNEVVVFNRDAAGLLTKVGSITTGGTGSGGDLDPLGSQGSLALSGNKKWVLAVNAGSDEISVLRVRPRGLDLVDKVDSGGIFPVSLAIFGNLVYVLNAGSPNITGFKLSPRGELTPLVASTRSLGSGEFGQVGFDLRGDNLVITDKANNEILVYPMTGGGLPAANPVVSMSNGTIPLGFTFDKRGDLLVVEAGSNAVSSYRILHDGDLQVISPSVPNGQDGACRIAVNKLGFIFTANPGSSSISFYKLNTKKGSLVLHDDVAGIGNKPIDLAVTTDGQFLYASDPGSGTIDMFRIDSNGRLINLGALAGGFSIFAQGIAIR